MRNTSAAPGTIVVNIYSDNAYVYQAMATVEASAYFPLYFGVHSLGYLSSDPAQPGKPVVVTLRPSQGMVCIRSTNQPAGFRAPNPATYPCVFGLSAQLIPLD